MQVLTEDLIKLYYALPNPRKAVAWHMDEEDAIDLFMAEALLLRNCYLPSPLPITCEEIKTMLAHGRGHLLGLPVIVHPRLAPYIEVDGG